MTLSSGSSWRFWPVIQSLYDYDCEPVCIVESASYTLQRTGDDTGASLLWIGASSHSAGTWIVVGAGCTLTAWAGKWITGTGAGEIYTVAAIRGDSLAGPFCKALTGHEPFQRILFFVCCSPHFECRGLAARERILISNRKRSVKPPSAICTWCLGVLGHMSE